MALGKGESRGGGAASTQPMDDPYAAGRAAAGAGGGSTTTKPASKPRKPRKSSQDIYAQALQQMLTGGSYGQGADELLKVQTQGNQQLQQLLGNIATQSEGTINTSAQALQSMLQGQQNPYANFQAQAAQATPQLQQLLEAQGAQTDPLAQFVAATNMANQAQAGAFQNIAGTAGNAWQQGQQQMLGSVEAQRLADIANMGNMRQQQEIALQQQLAGFQQQAAASKEQSRMQMMQMLLAAIQAGGRPRGGRLF